MERAGAIPMTLLGWPGRATGKQIFLQISPAQSQRQEIVFNYVMLSAI